MRRSRLSCAHSNPAGFSLIELVVVISVASLLMAMLMPAMNQIRENAHRVICANNQRQVGQSLVIFHDDNRDALPKSAALHLGESPRELSIARRSVYQNTQNTIDGWDGLGMLYAGHYCPAYQSFYCPSHHAHHPMERYENLWNQTMGPSPIYTNFHYCGDMDWTSGARRRLSDGYELVLLTDSLRTTQDFNHKSGMNMLRGDGSVRWTDKVERVVDLLPSNDNQPDSDEYLTLWEQVVGGTD